VSDVQKADGVSAAKKAAQPQRSPGAPGAISAGAPSRRAGESRWRPAKWTRSWRSMGWGMAFAIVVR